MPIQLFSTENNTRSFVEDGKQTKRVKVRIETNNDNDRFQSLFRVLLHCFNNRLSITSSFERIENEHSNSEKIFIDEGKGRKKERKKEIIFLKRLMKRLNEMK